MAEQIVIGDVRPRIQYSADGVELSFIYPFAIFTAADLQVYLDDTLQETGYSVSGAGESDGGTVDFDVAPANGVVVTLLRYLTIERTTDFQEGGAFRAKVINDQLDFLTACLQQVSDDMARAMKLSAPDSDVVLELPLKSSRAGKVLGFDDNGTPIAEVSPGDIATAASNAAIVTATALTVASDAATAEAAATAATAAAATLNLMETISTANGRTTQAHSPLDQQLLQIQRIKTSVGPERPMGILCLSATLVRPVTVPKALSWGGVTKPGEQGPKYQHRQEPISTLLVEPPIAAIAIMGH